MWGIHSAMPLSKYALYVYGGTHQTIKVIIILRTVRQQGAQPETAKYAEAKCLQFVSNDLRDIKGMCHKRNAAPQKNKGYNSYLKA
jgi:hypothetical protein